MRKELNARPAKALNQRPTSKTLQPSTYMANGSKQPFVSNSAQSVSKPVAAKPQAVPSKPAVSQAADVRTIKQDKPAGKQVSDNSVPKFVEALRAMVGPFAILSDEVILKNTELASGKGMDNDDRVISFECADYLMSNLAYIFMGLVLDENFKNAFLSSLDVELKIDEQPADVKAKMREEMKDTNEYKSAGSMIIGVTMFVPAIETELMNKMQKSFDSLDKFTEEFDSAVEALTIEQKVEYGYIFSNWMYLIRAFTHNDLFMSYVITVIERVKENLFQH